ncbi:5815_t:CDS:1, partial [Funneliformis geosporum]
TKFLANILLCNDIIAEYDDGKIATLQQYLFSKQSIKYINFIPTEVNDDTEYVKVVSTYILRITDIMINRQKVVAKFIDIKSFLML